MVPPLSAGRSSVAPSSDAPSSAATSAPIQDASLRPAGEWRLGSGVRWIQGALVFEMAGRETRVAASPALKLSAGGSYAFHADGELSSSSELTLALEDAKTSKVLAERRLRAGNLIAASLEVAPRKDVECRLVILAPRRAAGRIERFVARSSERRAPKLAFRRADTTLAHWGPVRRWLHGRCKSSRRLNSLVAAMEMRLGREEVVSLPMYMSLCPTGQCNALCAFCSVTVNRTGVVKKQLPFERLERLLDPVAGTIHMFGLEGNGEPTLYDEFDDLVTTLVSQGATLYLITNGERLTTEQIDRLASLQVSSVNFSLNAATAETHRRVMRLRSFDTVVENIRRLVAARAGAANPVVSASFVVHHDNVHETVDFIRFAESDLGVDRIYIRPLSELGGELGAVEDLRSLVPFESEVRDALEAVEEYLADAPSPRGDRGGTSPPPRRAQVEIDPSTFLSVRPDPVDRVLLPWDCENRLLAPRRRSWTALQPRLQVVWRHAAARLVLPADTEAAGQLAGGALWRSSFTPVEPDRRLELRLSIRGTAAGLRVAVAEAGGHELASQAIRLGGTGEPVRVSLEVPTGAARRAQITFSHDGGPVDVEVDFERLWAPGPGLDRGVKLPSPKRWQIDSPGTEVDWSGARVAIRWGGKPGPYLLRSYSVPCLPGVEIALPIRVAVRSGVLSVGILSEDAQHWAALFEFGRGDETSTLRFSTGTNRRFQVVLSSNSNEPLDAEVDWQTTLEPGTEWAEAPAASPEASRPKGSETPLAGRESELARNRVAVDHAPRRPGRLAAIGRALRGTRVRVRCQKPWTDLHNFSVDGRMDVCCIATGSSQARFALGNLFEQDFQDVWNGSTAKEFRRTVNSAKPLPPCVRCPLLHKYQGPFFDPKHTLGCIRNAIARRLGVLPGAQRLSRAASAAVCWLVDAAFFRGFQR